ncbi:hypothetical protein NIES970_17130 [[Synechococcus] sp. NIES-970]|uniref:hypothetical protein n=1 Tax=Picosynechococcus sp. NKBG15041c TaxID=1407650 RepID=UPI000409804D|nr:hypothetical protein [Picosynechococcus sp. NKBG15041c]BAW96774.1 hypothetical protein NIES970_17130 [[Synechococcus] sp. NIES-970]
MKVQLPISPAYLLSPCAPIYLIGHRLGHVCTQALVSTGVWSEEIFRGDRLPSLPFPETEQPD